jgi:NADH-quinone oxidoreductase subunit L
VVALAGIAVAGLLYFGRRLPEGVTRRSQAARSGYAFLANKYYLDHLYTGLVVGSIKGAIARAAYWFNQRVLDGIVNAVGTASRRGGELLYRYVDQGVVDRSVNGSGHGAEGAGGLLRTMQTGRVQQYAGLLFGGATVLAVVLVVVTAQ